MQELSIIEAIVLGVVEGITEYLPISSTGHLIITSALMKLDEPEEVKHAVDAYNIVIQGGAILAVIGLYWQHVLSMLRGLFGKDVPGRRLFTNLVVAFIPAAILGVLLNDLIEHYLFHTVPVLFALGAGGVLMIGLGPWQRKIFSDEDGDHFLEIGDMTWKHALAIGLFQCVAMFPGTSRSMMTIVGGMLMGLRPKHAAEFSFLLALPTLGGACVYKMFKNVTGDGPNMFDVLGLLPVIVGIAAATLSAALAVKWLVGYLSAHGVAIFGWYRLALCLVMGLLIQFGVVQF